MAHKLNFKNKKFRNSFDVYMAQTKNKNRSSYS